MSSNNKYVGLLNLSKEFKDAYDNIEKPYHLNIIEELHINENAHSRILAKLLQCSSKDLGKVMDKDKVNKIDNKKKVNFVFLESLLEYIKNNKRDFSKIELKNPEITQEKNRIDLLVLDRSSKCAIIFENKIYGARDRDKQLHNYINKVEKEKIKKENIFIVYLTDTFKAPNDTTWKNRNEKKEFYYRFCNLSYIHNIKPWLENELNKVSEIKQPVLRSALIQYIDYLKCLFELSEDYNGIEELIVKHNNNKMVTEEKKIQNIEEKLDELTSLNIALVNMKENCRKKIYKKWLKNNQLPDSVQLENNNEVFPETFISRKDKLLHVYISDDDDGKGMYVQAELLDKNKKPYPLKQKSTIIESLNDILPSPEDIDSDKVDKYARWKYCGQDYKGVYDLFNNVVTRLYNKVRK